MPTKFLVLDDDRVLILRPVSDHRLVNTFKLWGDLCLERPPRVNYSVIWDARRWVGVVQDEDMINIMTQAERFRVKYEQSPGLVTDFIYLALRDRGAEFLVQQVARSRGQHTPIVYTPKDAWNQLTPPRPPPRAAKRFLNW